MSTSPLAEQTRALLERLADATTGTPAAALAVAQLERFDEPLRLAIAGKVKAGKSTLLNTLVGEKLAPTDAGERTRLVTWYRNGIRYAARLELTDGREVEVPLHRSTDGAIDVDLADHSTTDITRVIIDWPSTRLSDVTVIDTPGLESLSVDVSARTTAFLTPDDDVTPADAVLYLLRHAHAADIRFLEAFHEADVARASPVNAIGVLSRVDEIGGGRLDSLDSAARIADRYRNDPKLQRLCQTVVPVAGLLAEAGHALTETDFHALRQLSGLDEDVRAELLATVDRFTDDDLDTGVDAGERRHLLERLGLFGIRTAIEWIRTGEVASAADLADELVARSGVAELGELLRQQFVTRADVLKAHTALVAVGAILDRYDVADADAFRLDLDRILASAHELTELALLNALRSREAGLDQSDHDDACRLLGLDGYDAHSRLGLAATASDDEVRDAALAAIDTWRSRSADPMTTRDLRQVHEVLSRTAEGIYAAVS